MDSSNSTDDPNKEAHGHVSIDVETKSTRAVLQDTDVCISPPVNAAPEIELPTRDVQIDIEESPELQASIAFETGSLAQLAIVERDTYPVPLGTKESAFRWMTISAAFIIGLYQVALQNQVGDRMKPFLFKINLILSFAAFIYCAVLWITASIHRNFLGKMIIMKLSAQPAVVLLVLAVIFLVTHILKVM